MRWITSVLCRQTNRNHLFGHLKYFKVVNVFSSVALILTTWMEVNGSDMFCWGPLLLRSFTLSCLLFLFAVVLLPTSGFIPGSCYFVLDDVSDTLWPQILLVDAANIFKDSTCVVRSFLIFKSVSSISFCGQVIIPTYACMSVGIYLLHI